jgi:hypothetical protein
VLRPHDEHTRSTAAAARDVTERAQEIDIGAFRSGRARVPLRPLEVASGARRGSMPRGLRAETIMQAGWDRGGEDPLSLRPPIRWEEACRSNRSWAYELQAWTPLTPLLTRFEDTGERRFFEFALEVMLDWISQYPSSNVKSEFAWYDVAIGARAQRVGFALDVVARDTVYEDAIVAELVDATLMHAELLREDDIVAWHSNHGLLVAASQLALATRFPDLPGFEADSEQADDRLLQLVQRQFTDEGVHREHSPDYHASVLGAIIGLLQDGIATAPELAERRREIEDALAWFILPTGGIATFGDSDWRRLGAGDGARHESAALTYARTQGREGRAPEDRVRCFRRSGYLVVRTWPGPEGFEQASYLAQTAAFHSRTHKHADDLAVIWQERGVDLLVDPGRFGYLGRTEADSELAAAGFWYAHPARIYVESTRAHNTVEIDGRSNPRAGVEPYGSALLDWGERGDVCYSLTRFRPQAQLVHSRTLVFLPGRWLLIVDDLVDEAEQPHDLTQWFHFGTEVEVTAHQAMLTGALPHPELRLFCVPCGPVEPVSPVRGQVRPGLLGWVAPREGVLEPTWTGGYRVRSAPRARFVTLLALAAKPPTVNPSGPSETGRPVRLTWHMDGLEESITADWTDRSVHVIYGT